MGPVEVGIADGTAAWLAVNTGFGHVRNLLENATRPEQADERRMETRPDAQAAREQISPRHSYSMPRPHMTAPDPDSGKEINPL